jgi:hypothetical protein
MMNFIRVSGSILGLARKACCQVVENRPPDLPLITAPIPLKNPVSH